MVRLLSNPSDINNAVNSLAEIDCGGESFPRHMWSVVGLVKEGYSAAFILTLWAVVVYRQGIDGMAKHVEKDA